MMDSAQSNHPAGDDGSRDDGQKKKNTHVIPGMWPAAIPSFLPFLYRDGLPPGRAREGIAKSLVHQMSQLTIGNVPDNLKTRAAAHVPQRYQTAFEHHEKRLYNTNILSSSHMAWANAHFTAGTNAEEDVRNRNPQHKGQLVHVGGSVVFGFCAEEDPQKQVEMARVLEDSMRKELADSFGTTDIVRIFVFPGIREDSANVHTADLYALFTVSQVIVTYVSTIIGGVDAFLSSDTRIYPIPVVIAAKTVGEFITMLLRQRLHHQESLVQPSLKGNSQLAHYLSHLLPAATVHI
jgi:hypothetical protein